MLTVVERLYITNSKAKLNSGECTCTQCRRVCSHYICWCPAARTLGVKSVSCKPSTPFYLPPLLGRPPFYSDPECLEGGPYTLYCLEPLVCPAASAVWLISFTRCMYPSLRNLTVSFTVLFSVLLLFLLSFRITAIQ